MTKRTLSNKTRSSILKVSGFRARMGGMPGPMEDEKGRPTRKALSLRKWNCN